MQKIALFSLSMALAATNSFAADQYIVRVPANVQAAPASEPTPPAEPLSVSLAGFSLPSGTVGQPYAPFDLFSVLSISEAGYSMSDVNWSLKQGTSLPLGLSLTTDGKISGTPTTKNEAGSEFEVVASYKEVSGQRAYTIVVNGVTPAGWDTPIQGTIVENDFTMAGQGFNAKAAKGLSSGKGYWEIKVKSASTYPPVIGIVPGNLLPGYRIGQDPAYYGVGWYPHGIGGNGCQWTACGFSSTILAKTGDVFGMAVDVDAKKIHWYYNGNFVATTSNITTPLPWYPGISNPAALSSTVLQANFGENAFAHAVPEGFQGWSSVQ